MDNQKSNIENNANINKQYFIEEDEISLIDIIKILWRQKWFIILSFIIMTAIGSFFIIKYKSKTTYQIKVKIDNFSEDYYNYFVDVYNIINKKDSMFKNIPDDLRVKTAKNTIGKNKFEYYLIFESNLVNSSMWIKPLKNIVLNINNLIFPYIYYDTLTDVVSEKKLDIKSYNSLIEKRIKNILILDYLMKLNKQSRKNNFIENNINNIYYLPPEQQIQGIKLSLYDIEITLVKNEFCMDLLEKVENIKNEFDILENKKNGIENKIDLKNYNENNIEFSEIEKMTDSVIKNISENSYSNYTIIDKNDIYKVLNYYKTSIVDVFKNIIDNYSKYNEIDYEVLNISKTSLLKYLVILVFMTGFISLILAFIIDFIQAHKDEFKKIGKEE